MKVEIKIRTPYSPGIEEHRRPQAGTANNAVPVEAADVFDCHQSASDREEAVDDIYHHSFAVPL